MRVAVVSGRGAARWRRGHPWIYRSDVIEGPGERPGAVAVVDERRVLVGVGLWSPSSTISLRMLTREEREVDAGFWEERIARAVGYRAGLELGATAYRVVHGEADGLPSLVVDRYGDVLVAQFLSAGLEVYRAEVLDALRRATGAAGLLLRNDVPVRQHERLAREVEVGWGEVPDEVEVDEGGVRYLAGLRTGQKTGAFLDQRENRARAGMLSRGRALDCFSYHGSFALHLAAGAEEVTAVDSSAPALERARSNARLNGMANVRVEEANVFDFLRACESTGATYDTIVLDPPAFAKRKDALRQALRGYKEINLRAMRVLSPGGHLCTFSCSYHVGEALFREMLEEAAADAGRPVRWVEGRGQAADHPVLLQVPETGYLKGAILQAV